MCVFSFESTLIFSCILDHCSPYFCPVMKQSILTIHDFLIYPMFRGPGTPELLVAALIVDEIFDTLKIFMLLSP